VGHLDHGDVLEPADVPDPVPALWGGCDLLNAVTAIVLAAGARRCDSSAGAAVPKPLVPVAGTALVARTLYTLWKQGIDRAVVVTGHAADEIEAGIRTARGLSALDIRFVRNTGWARQNGLSALTARPLTGDAPFLITPGDRVYSGSIVAALRAAPICGAGALVAVERRLDRVRDVEAAVRVRTDVYGRIRAIGKALVEYDGVATGLLLCRPALFDVLDEERVLHGGDCSVVDGIRRLAREGRAFAVDIPAHAWWHDVDTLADLRLAEVSVSHGLATRFG
jgi:choline kinase